MRLEAQKRLGFYPAPPAAVSFIADKLLPPEAGPVVILDPCCGEGNAVVQLAQHLRAKPYGIELDERRFEIAHRALTEAGGACIGPASFHGCHVSHGSFSLAWVNPPFDDELGGGGREEESFLARATQLLAPKGIMCLVCPQRVASSYEIIKQYRQWFTDCRVFPFPEGCRKYDEVVIVGRKRQQAIDHWLAPEWAMVLAESDKITHWRLPSCAGPRKFLKVELTEAEAGEEMARSPLRKLLEPPPDRPLPRPPMSLSKGHLAMLLAAGHLDGVVQPPGEPPHVVRGTAKKVDYLAEESEEVDDSGRVTNKKIYSQKMVLTVRTVTPDGKITTFSQE